MTFVGSENERTRLSGCHGNRGRFSRKRRLEALRDGLKISALMAFWIGCGGCATSEQQQAQRPETSSARASETLSGTSLKEADWKALTLQKEPEAPWPWSERAASHKVTHLSFDGQMTLRIGYDDGAVQLFDADTLEARLIDVAAHRGSEVMTVSPSNSLVMLKSSPPVLIRTSDGKEVLRMNHIEGPVESATFTHDGEIFFLTQPTGQLHLWKANEEGLKRLPDERLQTFLDRQLPDYIGYFPAMRGPIVALRNRELMMSDDQGHLLRWEPKHQEQVTLVIKLPKPAQAIDVVDDQLVASTGSNDLRVAEISSRSFRPWSMSASGTWVKISAGAPGALAITDAEGLRIQNLENGDILGHHSWNQPLPISAAHDAETCGLAWSEGAHFLAICRRGHVLVVRLNPQSNNLSLVPV